MKSKAQLSQADPLLIHNLINKVSIIIGNCDLLIEKQSEGTEIEARLAIIRDAAKRIAADLEAMEGQSVKVQKRKAS